MAVCYRPGTVKLISRERSPFWYIEYYDPDARRMRKVSTKERDRAAAEGVLAAFLEPPGEKLEADPTPGVSEAPAGEAEPVADTRPSPARPTPTRPTPLRPTDGGASSQVPVATVLDYYWQRHACDIASYEQAEVAIRHLARLHAGRAITELSRDVQQDYVDIRFDDEGISHATIKREISVLKAALNFYAADHRGLELPRIYDLGQVEPRTRWLTPEEVDKLLKACRHRHMYLYVLLAVGTAGRPEAILDLRWNDIDFAGGIIHLNAAGREQTNKNRPTIRMSTTLQKALQAARLTAETDFVIEWAGYPINSIRTAFDTLVEDAALDRPHEVTPKTLRHTAATWMAQDGVPLWDIAHYLGHGTTRMVERYYAHHHPDYQHKATSAIDARMADLPVDDSKLEPTSEKQKRRRGTRAAKPAGTPQLAHPTPTTERLRARPTSGGVSEESRKSDGGRCWDRTSDPYGVNVVLFR